MPGTTRRNLFKSALAAAAVVPLQSLAGASKACAEAQPAPTWRRGLEGQRHECNGEKAADHFLECGIHVYLLW